jgi:hypothetical protein
VKWWDSLIYFGCFFGVMSRSDDVVAFAGKSNGGAQAYVAYA